MTTCYVGCDMTGKLVTHAPVVPHALAFTGFDFVPVIVIGVAAAAAGLFLLAESRLRKWKP